MAPPSNPIRNPPARGFARRLVTCLVGLAVFGAGIALIVNGDLGNGPWDVFHQGLADHLGIGIGVVIIGVGFALVLLWIPLHVRPGLGTLLNAVVVGVVVDLVLPILPDTDRLVPRICSLAAGIVMMGAGTGMYLGANLGPGPRDGLMTGLAARGWQVRIARTAIEVAVLGLGVLLGGTIGVGTAIFALTIGPLVQFFIPRFADPDSPTASDSGYDTPPLGVSRCPGT